MRVKVYSHVDEHAGKPPLLDLNDGACKYRVRIWHDGAEYEIAPDSENKLVLHVVGGRQLEIKPRASNEVRISAERWW
jgi:hypothetical protein